MDLLRDANGAIRHALHGQRQRDHPAGDDLYAYCEQIGQIATSLATFARVLKDQADHAKTLTVGSDDSKTDHVEERARAELGDRALYKFEMMAVGLANVTRDTEACQTLLGRLGVAADPDHRG